MYLRNRIVKEQLDRVTLAADLGSDVLASDNDQNYVVMGSINDNNDNGEQRQQGNDASSKNKNTKDENLIETGVPA